MSRIIFQVSRARYAKSTDAAGNETKIITQLRLKERYNAQREQVTAMATLHFNQAFLSGMHYCYVDDQGDRYYSWNKEEGVDFKVDFNINFEEKHLSSLMKQVEKMGDKLISPAKDEDGVSMLRGVQLHVVLVPDAELGLNHKEDVKHGDRLQKKVQPYSITTVELVTASDPEYVEAPDTQTLSADLAIQAVYTKTEKSVINKPATKEEAKATILGMMTSRKEKRQSFKQAARDAVVVSPPTISQPAPISLVDDEDEEQPE